MSAGSERPSGGVPIGGISSVSVAAHELKSPLILLRQLALELESDTMSKQEQRRVVEQMREISERALRLTSDVTRADSLQLGLFETGPVNPLGICEDVVSELSSYYAAHNKKLKVGRIRNLPPVVANRDLLRRILMNFADNALHYADYEGVVELQAQLSRERNVVRMSVRDYGPNLPISAWHKLVTQLSERQAVHQRPQSSGLGLYIAHKFAHSMNGQIGAIRHRDGASFYVELPISQQLRLL